MIGGDVTKREHYHPRVFLQYGRPARSRSARPVCAFERRRPDRGRA